MLGGIAPLLSWTSCLAMCPAFTPGADLTGMVNPHTLALEQAATTRAARVIAVLLALLAIGLAMAFALMNDDGDDFPPRAAASVAQTTAALSSGGFNELVRTMSERVGTVFRLPLPTWRRVYVCADRQLALAILGDAAHRAHRLPLPARLGKGPRALLRACHCCRTSHGRWDPHELLLHTVAREALGLPEVGATCQRHAEAWLASLLAGASTQGDCERVARLGPCTRGFGLALLVDVLCAQALSAEERASLQPDLDCCARAAATWPPWLLPSRRRGAELAQADAASERLLACGARLLRAHAALPQSARGEPRRAPIERIAASAELGGEQERAAALMGLLLCGEQALSRALAWALLELASHPQAQDALRAALCRPSEPQRAAAELAHVLQETLRLHGATEASTVRELAHNVPLPAAKRRIFIPRGSVVHVHVQAVLASACELDQPERWWPDRWDACTERRETESSCPSRAFVSGLLSPVLVAAVGRYSLERVEPDDAECCASGTAPAGNDPFRFALRLTPTSTPAVRE